MRDRQELLGFDYPGVLDELTQKWVALGVLGLCHGAGRNLPTYLIRSRLAHIT